MGSYAGNFVSSIFSFIFIIFLISDLGYLLGGIKIKGIGLGTAGVLIIAIIWGIFINFFKSFTVKDTKIYLWSDSIKSNYSVLSSMGTALFVTAVGLISGPRFFRSFNKEVLIYILLAFIITVIAFVLGIIFIFVDKDVNAEMAAGLMMGAITSTPGLSAAKEVAKDEDAVVAGYGIAYLFGVIDVVLFVQLTPKIMRVNMEEEVANFQAACTVEIPEIDEVMFSLDKLNFFPFFFAIAIGCLIGTITIPGINFKLGNSGGCLIGGLIVGHFQHMGKLDCRVKKETLNFFRELGLVLFLIGAGVPGGVNFITKFKVLYFVYGIIISLVPMIVTFLIAKFLFKIKLLNNLGAITGGMTSTPALGALITTCGTDEVSSCYAAAYPFALVFKVIIVKILIAAF